MRAAEHAISNFYPVPDDAARAVIACRRDRLNGALETVKRMSFPIDVDFETLIVVIATNVAGSHRNLHWQELLFNRESKVGCHLGIESCKYLF